MKKVIVLVMLFITIGSQLFAQSAPDGVNYQAVARNQRGEVLANQPVALRVSLFGIGANNSKTEYYREVHSVTTSIVGVFSLIIGKGTTQSGNFNVVPWSTENVWMEIAIKSRGDGDYATISNSKLLAVPYAMHAMTAGKLSGLGPVQSATSTGSPSQSWLLFGNVGSNPLTDKLGTTDSVDLIIVSNNQERIRVFGNGNVNIKKNTNMEGTLNVQKSVFLNQTSGATINYGPFTVDRKSNTFLSGTLVVDSSTDLNQSLNVDGTTDLNSRLNVNNLSPTFLSGALTVNGITNLNNSLNVNLLSPTLLTGTLKVDKPALFKDTVLLDNLRQSFTPSTGTLVVKGGFGLGGNLNVGGDSKFGGSAEFAGPVSFTDPTQSTSTSTGAVKVTGGVGIGKRLNVGEAAAIGGALTVTGKTTLNDATESTSLTTGGLIVAGGTAITKNTNIGGTLTVNQATEIKSSLTVTSTNANITGGYIANFTNPTGGNGLNIQVNNTTSNVTNSNHFITFKNAAGGVVGTIQGETTAADLANNQDYVDAKTFKSIAIALAAADVIIMAAESVEGGIKVVASATSSTVCVGFGACFTAPIPSLIIESGANLILKIANAVVKVANLATISADLGVYISHKNAQLGVTYASGSGDYAEWLQKKDISETFNSGDIVCLKNGRISRNIEEGGKMMVISEKPIVLGNTPAANNEMNFAKVAFIGQVPVKVLGKVKKGDYILPSGYDKGFGVGVSPENMKIGDYKRIVGVAWEDTDGDPYGFVNTAVGLNVNDYSSIIENQQEQLKKQQSEIDDMKKTISQIVAQMSNIKDNTTASNPASTFTPPVKNHTLPVTSETGMPAMINGSLTTVHPTVPDQTNILYYKLTQTQIDQMFDMAEKVFQQSGAKMEDHPFWSKMKSDPSYRKMIQNQIEDQYEKALEIHMKVNHLTR